MIALIQRVSRATVNINAVCVAEIDTGILALIGVEQQDTESQAARLVERILGYRVFNDSQGRMNLSVSDIDGGLLLVPQFTLAADTNKGKRPSFTSAATPSQAQQLFAAVVSLAQSRHTPVESGEFAADMQVALINNGPVTFWLQV